MALGEEDKPPVASTQRCSKSSTENKEKTGIPGPRVFSKQFCLDYTCIPFKSNIPKQNEQLSIHLKPTLCSLKPDSRGKPWERQQVVFHLFPSTHAKDLHSPSLTWNLQMMISKRNLLFQGTISRFHVKL